MVREDDEAECLLHTTPPTLPADLVAFFFPRFFVFSPYVKFSHTDTLISTPSTIMVHSTILYERHCDESLLVAISRSFR